MTIALAESAFLSRWLHRTRAPPFRAPAPRSPWPRSQRSLSSPIRAAGVLRHQHGRGSLRRGLRLFARIPRLVESHLCARGLVRLGGLGERPPPRPPFGDPAHMRPLCSRPVVVRPWAASPAAVRIDLFDWVRFRIDTFPRSPRVAASRWACPSCTTPRITSFPGSVCAGVGERRARRRAGRRSPPSSKPPRCALGG